MERFGDKVEGSIGGAFGWLGRHVGTRPKQIIFACFVLTAIMGVGYISWEPETRGEELWVPQGTEAEEETDMYEEYYNSKDRIETMIVQASPSASSTNVLTKDMLLVAMEMHTEIATRESEFEGETNTLPNLCVKAGGTCANKESPNAVCGCLINSILKQWNYDLATLQSDDDVLTTINNYGSREDLEAITGLPVFDDNDQLVSAQAFTLSYFLEGMPVVTNGREEDPVNEQWEEDVFLSVAESVPEDYQPLSVDYFSTRSFQDEFGNEINSDLFLTQIAYVVAFLFLAANIGKIKCGTGSRWTMAFAALVTVGISTAAGFGLSSLFGLFFGPVHSLLPFLLLGIGVDDVFVIVNAFNRERKGTRASEDNDTLAERSSRAMARAGASITVTSATDLVAFAISSSSSLPALASFCAYAAISIFFLWFFSATFFSSTMVLDERRQRDNRRECLCCVTRKNPLKEDDSGFKEDLVSRYFRNYHAPAILSKIGKGVVLLCFAGLLAFGIYGVMNLTVEDTERAFIPSDSYLQDYFDAGDKYFPDTGIDLFIVFEDSSDIYSKRVGLAALDERVSGFSEKSPWIAEPVSEKAYQNVMTGLGDYLDTEGSSLNITLGSDGWPTTEAEFVQLMKDYVSFGSPGAEYAQDVAFNDEETEINAIRVHLEYVRLTKLDGGDIIDDADRQIDAMDDTRKLVASWDDLTPGRFPYSDKFITIEGFKIIQRELFLNVGLAILAVGVIVFFTLPSPATALLITANVAACIIEILGCMQALGIVIDSVSVINIVAAVGLSVDYSAHVGHCFMFKGGDDKNRRSLESLADIGAAVLSGAISTFLAVVVLLFSSSYVFVTLSRQLVLTVGLGIAHGLILLPVLLAMFGPKPFGSAEPIEDDTSEDDAKSSENEEPETTADFEKKPVVQEESEQVYLEDEA